MKRSKKSFVESIKTMTQESLLQTYFVIKTNLDTFKAYVEFCGAEDDETAAKIAILSDYTKRIETNLLERFNYDVKEDNAFN